MANLRLQKVLADAGVASRRKCEEIIKAGRVAVDGETVTRLGTKVDPEKQAITVDGRRVRVTTRVYYILNKPVGFECTNAAGKKRAIDLIPGQKARLYTAGRLDVASEGVLLVTNDGELAQIVAHPRHGVEKVYEVIADGELSGEVLAKIRKGVWSGSGKLRFENVKVKKKSRRRVKLEVVLREGKNREIRRALAAVGLKVRRLRRIRIGKISLGKLASGQSRRASSREIAYLESLRRRGKGEEGKRGRGEEGKRGKEEKRKRGREEKRRGK